MVNAVTPIAKETILKVIEVEVAEGGGEVRQPFDVLDQVLPQADAGYLFEALEAEGGDRLDSGMCANDLVSVRVFAVEQI